MHLKQMTNYLTTICCVLALGGCDNRTGSQPHAVSPWGDGTIQQHFAYSDDGEILVSGHRGGRAEFFPENSIEGFQYAVDQMPIFFEIDPRLTKDSVIVLMHDATLDRTTTKQGRLIDNTWAELQDTRLVDHFGNVTECKIPLLRDVIMWSRGKTVVNLDKKDVPMDMIVDLIRECGAEREIMLTVHTGAQARYYYDRLPGAMLSVFARNDKEYEDMAISGVPWESMIAYVGASIGEKNEHIVKKLRKNGVRCMISVAPSHDKLESKELRAEGYRVEIAKSPDIIESDLPTELWSLIVK